MKTSYTYVTALESLSRLALPPAQFLLHTFFACLRFRIFKISGPHNLQMYCPGGLQNQTLVKKYFLRKTTYTCVSALGSLPRLALPPAQFLLQTFFACLRFRIFKISGPQNLQMYRPGGLQIQTLAKKYFLRKTTYTSVSALGSVS